LPVLPWRPMLKARETPAMLRHTRSDSQALTEGNVTIARYGNTLSFEGKDVFSQVAHLGRQLSKTPALSRVPVRITPSQASR
jgi:hypothetical protein